jgi:hypothetical protein
MHYIVDMGDTSDASSVVTDIDRVELTIKYLLDEDNSMFIRPPHFTDHTVSAARSAKMLLKPAVFLLSLPPTSRMGQGSAI